MRPTGVLMVSMDQDDAFRGQYLLQLGTRPGYSSVVSRVSCSNLDKTRNLFRIARALLPVARLLHGSIRMGAPSRADLLDTRLRHRSLETLLHGHRSGTGDERTGSIKLTPPRQGGEGRCGHWGKNELGIRHGKSDPKWGGG